MVVSAKSHLCLPKGWIECNLPDFCNIVMGQSPPSTTYNTTGDGLPFYQGKSEFGPLHPTPRQYCSQPGKIAEEGSTLLSVRAPVGPTNLVPHRACIGRGLAAISGLCGITSKFVLYLLRSVEPVLSTKGTGTTFKAITKDFLLNLSFPLPPLPEQERIVAKIEELFSDLDHGVALLRKVQAQLKVYRQAVLKYAFEGKLTAEWRKANAEKLEPAEKLLEKIKLERETHYNKQLADWEKATKKWQNAGSNGKKPTKPRKHKELPPLTKEEFDTLPELPYEWSWIKIGELSDVVRGGSPRPAGDPKYYGGSIPFLKVADITGDNRRHVDSCTFTIKEAGLRKTRLIQPETLLLSNSGATLGVPKICMIEATFNDGIAAFLGLDPRSLLFHYYFWLSRTEELRGINQGAAQPNLNTDIIADISMPLCSQEEQDQIVAEIESRLSVCDKIEEMIEASLKKAESLRQSILKKAFEGKLVPQNPNDEPAETLLARIQESGS